MPAQCIPFKVETYHSKKYDECMYNNECKYHQVSFHLNTMTAHYTCTLFKLLYRRYKLTVIACRGLKRSLWPGWVRSRPFTCSSLFKAISPTLAFCNSKLGSCAFYVDFITVAILCFLTSEFSSVSCKEETVFPQLEKEKLQMF